MVMAFAIGICLAAAALAISGSDAKSLVLALRLTARWSFLLFWVAYAGAALGVLFGRVFEPLARRGREFGLAYAAAQLVHAAVVVWLYAISPRPPLSVGLATFFLVGIFWTYLLAIFSFGGLSQALGAKGWWTLRIVGMNYILFAFAFDFVPVSIHGPAHYGAWRLFQYAPFAAMTIAAPLLVVAAAVQRRLGIRYAHLRLEPVVN
jgi:hypothetical protein